jgi:Na+-transporting NADH:ubiquinone oxidoreductase subunit NqrB
MEDAVEANGNLYAEVNFHMPRKHKIKDVLTVAGIGFSLPLNGKWSVVTATFNVLCMVDCVSLELQEIHVF